MYFKRKSNIIFRNYNSFGYITDNRNFEYHLINGDEENLVGDKILSESGAIFFSVLDKESKSLDEIVKRIGECFTDVDLKTIENDAREFYSILENERFIVSGKTIEECEKKDIKFSYKTSNPGTIKKSFSNSKKYHTKDTQDFFEEYFKGKPQLTNLHIEITSKCNERCVHCYIPHENKINYIDSDLFYDVLRQCVDMKLLHLTISGGEPMLHKNFCDFLKKCRENNFSVHVLSNLTLLNEEIIKEMKMNPLLGVQVSLYSMNPDIHDEITQVKGSFEKTKNAILKLIDNDIPLQISCPIIKQNKNCFDDVVNWAKKYNIQVGDDYIIIARYNHTSQNLSCRLSIEEVEKIINDKVAKDEKYLEQIEIEAEKKKNTTPSDFVCSVCNSSICVADNGNVYPCAGWQDYVVGNVKETSLNEIWHNSKKVKYLRELRKKDFPKCLHCSDKEFCTMCMVRNANEDPLGNPLTVSEYFCNIAKINKKFVIDRKKQANKIYH